MRKKAKGEVGVKLKELNEITKNRLRKRTEDGTSGDSAFASRV